MFTCLSQLHPQNIQQRLNGTLQNRNYRAELNSPHITDALLPRKFTPWTTITRKFQIQPQNPSSASTPVAGRASSKDGTCRATVNCIGSTFGDFCSQCDCCDSTSAFCGKECNSVAGTCSSGLSGSSSIQTDTFSTSLISSTSTHNLATSNTSNSYPASSIQQSWPRTGN